MHKAPNKYQNHQLPTTSITKNPTTNTTASQRHPHRSTESTNDQSPGTPTKSPNAESATETRQKEKPTAQPSQNNTAPTPHKYRPDISDNESCAMCYRHRTPKSATLQNATAKKNSTTTSPPSRASRSAKTRRRQHQHSGRKMLRPSTIPTETIHTLQPPH